MVQTRHPLSGTKAAHDVGFKRGAFDNCLYYFRGSKDQFKGILGAHVDDGEGPEYKTAVERLRERFPYNKWHVGSEEFCRVQYTQCPADRVCPPLSSHCTQQGQA